MFKVNEHPNVASSGLKSMLESGQIKLKSITDLIPITWLCKEVELNYNTLARRLLDPKLLTALDIAKLSIVLNMDACALLTRILIEAGIEKGEHNEY